MQRVRVLIADDNAEYRHLLGRFIAAQPDMQLVGSAEDGEQAVRFSKASRPDVVLMDAVMPRLDGFEAARRIREIAPRSRVVVLTAHRSEENRRRAAEASAAFVSKSDVDSRLVETIRDLVRAAPSCGGTEQSSESGA